MGISFTTLFGQLKAIDAVRTSLNTYRGTTVPALIGTIFTDLSATPSLTNNLYSNLAGFQASPAAMLSQMQALFQQAILVEIDAEAPVTSNTLKAALIQLITEMVAGSQSVAAATLSSSVTAASGNNGNPAIAIGLLTSTGFQLDNIFNEVLTAVATGDQQSGTATLNQETLTVSGQLTAPSVTDWTYPAGSGATQSLTAVDAGTFNQSGASNYLNNGNFETWVGSVPTSWHVTAGGGNIAKSVTAGTFYDGLASLKIAGDGTTLTGIETQFGTGGDVTGDSPNGVLPITQYCFNLWLKVDVVPAAGVLEVALVNSSGTILQDVAGNNSAVTLNLHTGATTTFAPFNGFLRTPRVLPASVFLRVRLSTAMSSGSNLFIDRMAFTQPTPLYPQGPPVAAFSGSSPIIKLDQWSLTVNNNYGGVWQQRFDINVGMKALGLLLPTSGSPTIAA